MVPAVEILDGEEIPWASVLLPILAVIKRQAQDP